MSAAEVAARAKFLSPAPPPGLEEATAHALETSVGGIIGLAVNNDDDAPVSTVVLNAKHYARILVRRKARAIVEAEYARQRQRKGDAAGAAAIAKTYLHESRHKHAKKRQRGPGGRFLKKDDLAAYSAQHPEKGHKNCVLTEKHDDSAPEETKEEKEQDGSSCDGACCC
jgi:CCAAT-binding transcription factor (CBF-B/NF-YA) subunit B